MNNININFVILSDHIPDAKMSIKEVLLPPGSEDDTKVVMRDLEAVLPTVENDEEEELCEGPLSSAEKGRKISSITELTQVIIVKTGNHTFKFI